MHTEAVYSLSRCVQTPHMHTKADYSPSLPPVLGAICTRKCLQKAIFMYRRPDESRYPTLLQLSVRKIVNRRHAPCTDSQAGQRLPRGSRSPPRRHRILRENAEGCHGGARFLRQNAEGCHGGARFLRQNAEGCHGETRFLRQNAEGCHGEARFLRQNAEGCHGEARFLRQNAEGCHGEIRFLRQNAEGCRAPRGSVREVGQFLRLTCGTDLLQRRKMRIIVETRM